MGFNIITICKVYKALHRGKTTVRSIQKLVTNIYVSKSVKQQAKQLTNMHFKHDMT